jgi:hypothetical protein
VVPERLGPARRVGALVGRRGLQKVQVHLGLRHRDQAEFPWGP